MTKGGCFNEAASFFVLICPAVVIAKSFVSVSICGAIGTHCGRNDVVCITSFIQTTLSQCTDRQEISHKEARKNCSWGDRCRNLF